MRKKWNVKFCVKYCESHLLCDERSVRRFELNGYHSRNGNDNIFFLYPAIHSTYTEQKQIEVKKNENVGIILVIIIMPNEGWMKWKQKVSHDASDERFWWIQWIVVNVMAEGDCGIAARMHEIIKNIQNFSFHELLPSEKRWWGEDEDMRVKPVGREKKSTCKIQ